MSAEITKIIIDSLPNINVIGHPLQVAIIGGIAGGFMSLIGIIGVHQDSKKMWRNEIFVKKMQTELVNFYDSLTKTIKKNYDTCCLSKLINNEFDYNEIDFKTFFDEKLRFSQDLEEQFIFIQPFLKKCFKFDDKTLLKIFSCIHTSSLIFGYLASIKESLNNDIGPDIEDFFEMDLGNDFNEPQIVGLQKTEQKKLQDNFKIHYNSMNLTLSEQYQDFVNKTTNNVFLYRAYLGQIREELFGFKKLISEHMFKEI